MFHRVEIQFRDHPGNIESEIDFYTWMHFVEPYATNIVKLA